MYTFWIRLNPQLIQIEAEQFHCSIQRWGATLIPTGCATGDLAYKSRVRPATYLNRKVKEGVVSMWGYLSTTQTRKPKRNLTRKPTGASRIKSFENLKKRFGKTLDPGG